LAHWVLPFLRPIKVRNSGAVLLLAEELVVVVADEWCMGTRKERKILLLFGTGWVVRRNGAVCNLRTHPADARAVVV
jgi:hypothetical protein